MLNFKLFLSIIENFFKFALNAIYKNVKQSTYKKNLVKLKKITWHKKKSLGI